MAFDPAKLNLKQASYNRIGLERVRYFWEYVSAAQSLSQIVTDINTAGEMEAVTRLREYDLLVATGNNGSALYIVKPEDVIGTSVFTSSHVTLDKVADVTATYLW